MLLQETHNSKARFSIYVIDITKNSLDVKPMAVNEKQIHRSSYYRSTSQRQSLARWEHELQSSHTCGSLKVVNGKDKSRTNL